MCGILAVFQQEDEVDPSMVAGLRDLMVRRGPDAGGLYVSPDRRLALAHRRLSIIDLSTAADQPMSRDGLHLVYNGEIYNYRELRSTLEARGHAFRTSSDTEVLLAAWQEWGREAVARLEGMFAFAIYEEEPRRLTLVRDRLGIKPLYYHASEGLLIAASELNPVVNHPRVPRTLDLRAIDEYLTYCYVPPPRTIWRDAKKLPPGHWLQATAHGVVIQPYWDLQINPEPGPEGADARPAQQELAQRVADSVHSYLVADVPVGIFLSGGWDSSIVTSCARESYAGELNAFTIGFDVAQHSELPTAGAAAAHHGVVHYSRIVDRQMGCSALEELVQLFEEPFAASSAVPMIHLSRLAREQVKVVLSGDGGDEVFGGYRWYKRWEALQRGGAFWKSAPGRGVESAWHGLRGRRHNAWWLPGLEPLEQYAQLMGAIHPSDKRRLLSREFLDENAAHDPLEYFRRHDRPELPALSRLQWLDLKTFLPELCLTKVDRTTMAASLEARVPFLNHTLIEWMMRLPQGVRNPHGELKGLFKRTFEARVPDVVRAAKKKGFSAPAGDWYTAALLERQFEEFRLARPELARELFHPRFTAGLGNQDGPRRLRWLVLLRWLLKNADR